MSLGKVAPLALGLAVTPITDSPDLPDYPEHVDSSAHIDLHDTWPEQPREDIPQEDPYAIVPPLPRFESWIIELEQQGGAELVPVPSVLDSSASPAATSTAQDNREQEVKPRRPRTQEAPRVITKPQGPGWPEPRHGRNFLRDPKGRNHRSSVARSPRHKVLGI